MLLKKMLVMALAGLLVLAVWGHQSREEILYAESFEDGTFTGDVVRNNNNLSLNAVGGGRGEWNRTVDIAPEKLSWVWEGKDTGDFQLWLRLSFNNHNSLFYVAEGSMNPPSEGEYFKDEEGRRRFSPAAVISGIALGKVERDIRDDYKNCCGSADGLKIIG
ncbi:MAG: hypothetical protein Q8N79_08545, partial [Candidatus Methanoperedens sp.]|nr:hypothetical protein [Candidatus Methanoperedens sp.]